MNREEIARELVATARMLLDGSERVAMRNWVNEVIKELRELEKLGVEVPRKKMDKRAIESYFEDFDMERVGSRELSRLVDDYLLI